MKRRSSRIQEMGEKNELSCMWGLLSILESCQGRPVHRLITSGRPESRNAIDFPRQLVPIASFDEECRKIHNGASLRTSVDGDAKGSTARNRIGEDVPIEKQKSKQDVVKRQKYAKMDAELLDRLARNQIRTRKSSQDVYQSSSSCVNKAARVVKELPSSSAEMSLNKLTLAAILGAVCAQNHPEEGKLSEYLQRNRYLGMHDEVDEINIQQIQMRAKAFVDQMFILREGRNSESKSFSDALEVLNSKRNVFMELLPDPNSTLARRIKNSDPSQTEKHTLKSVLGANTSEPEEANSKGKPSDKIVILKPAHRNAKHPRNITCKSDTRVSEVKTTSFSFRDIKKKLKHTFGVAKKGPNSSDKPSRDVGSEWICQGVDIKNSLSCSPNVDKNQELTLKRGSDIASVSDTTRRKFHFSSARSSNKQECDVLLEAKKHLSSRLNNLNSVESVKSKKAPRTLERILSSPEHDFWPFSPRRDSLYVTGSAEMRFSPYNTSPRVIESSSHVRNELKPITEIASCDDQHRALLRVDSKAYSMILRTEGEEGLDTNISTTDIVKIDGKSETRRMKLHISEEEVSETNSTSTTEPSETMSTIEAQKCDGIVMKSVLDSHGENEIVTSTMDYFPSTTSDSHHLDTSENNSFQEEHQSPVSVLEPFFVEDADTPPRVTQTAGKRLQPHCLDFEECSFEPFPHSSMEEELCQYVQLILEASCLDWDQLSEITLLHEELLHESLFDEVELPSLDCYYDPKLLFDHINEVLLEISKCHFCSPPWLASAVPKMKPAPLAEVVLDEILAEADFFLLPITDKRTLDEIVSKEVSKSRSWFDVRLDTEHVVIEVSEAVLEESLLATLLEFHT